MAEGAFIMLYTTAIEKLGLTDAVVYCYLLGMGEDCHPKMETIAKACGMSPNSARRATNSLASKGVITIKENKGTSNSYTCVPPTKLVDLPLPKWQTTPTKLVDLPLPKKGIPPTKLVDPIYNTTYNINNNISSNISPNPQKSNEEIFLEVWCEEYKTAHGTEYTPDYRTQTNDIREITAKLDLKRKEHNDLRSEGDYYRAFIKASYMVATDWEVRNWKLSTLNNNFTTFFARIINNGKANTNNQRSAKPTANANPNAGMSAAYRERLAKRLASAIQRTDVAP